MRETLAIAGAVATDAVRRKVVWVVVLFSAALAIAIPSLPSYGVGVDVAVFREVSIALTWLAALIVAISISAPRIPMEIERRTIYAVLGRDVRRWQYVLGTWAGIGAVMAAVVLAFALVTIVVGAVRYGTVEFRLLEAGLAIWLESLVIAAVAVAFSTYTGTVTSVSATLAVAFVAHVYQGVLPPTVARFAPSLETFNVINPVAHGSGITIGYALAMIGAAAGWLVAVLGAGSLSFDRRDL